MATAEWPGNWKSGPQLLGNLGRELEERIHISFTSIMNIVPVRKLDLIAVLIWIYVGRQRQFLSHCGGKTGWGSDTSMANRSKLQIEALIRWLTAKRQGYTAQSECSIEGPLEVISYVNWRAGGVSQRLH